MISSTRPNPLAPLGVSPCFPSMRDTDSGHHSALSERSTGRAESKECGAVALGAWARGYVFSFSSCFPPGNSHLVPSPPYALPFLRRS